MRGPRALARFLLFVLVTQLLAGSFSAAAFADSLQHDREHAAQHDEDAGTGSSAPAEDAHDSCHASHHLQAFAGPAALAFLPAQAGSPAAWRAWEGVTAVPSPLFRPPRLAS